MTKLSILLSFFCVLIASSASFSQDNYLEYHSQLIHCEQLIAEEQNTAAIEAFDSLFDQFDFVFLRDIKVATEISVYAGDFASAWTFLRLGIKSGWTLKSIKRSNSLRSLEEHAEWTRIISEYDSLHHIYLDRLNLPLRDKVHDMYKRDQKKALGALFRFGQKAQDKYAENKFAPHSELQLHELERILNQYGFPGEQLIGNDLWASVILSHHNSISHDYNSADTLYDQLRPKLMTALIHGEISPYEFAQIEDWRTAARSGHEQTSLGYLGKIHNTSEFTLINENRSQIGLRSIELRNSLIDIENSTGMNLYLPIGWQKGKITVSD